MSLFSPSSCAHKWRVSWGNFIISYYLVSSINGESRFSRTYVINKVLLCCLWYCWIISGYICRWKPSDLLGNSCAGAVKISWKITWMIFWIRHIRWYVYVLCEELWVSVPFGYTLNNIIIFSPFCFTQTGNKVVQDHALLHLGSLAYFPNKFPPFC